MNKNDLSSTLRTILSELNCKLSADSIPEADIPGVCAFLEKEKEARRVVRLQRLLAGCGLNKHQLRTFDQLDWDFNPKMPRQEILAFRSSRWVDTAANLVLIGDVGIGKSHIAKALCYDAIQQGFSVYFATAFDLISKIKKAPSCSSKIEYYGKALTVLCIDELGYTVYQKEDMDILYQIVSKRCEMLPTIVTTNLLPKQWGSIFSGMAASAILDRLSANGQFLTWAGESYRARRQNKK
jgi:DNA replication protein DnaC